MELTEIDYAKINNLYLTTGMTKEWAVASYEAGLSAGMERAAKICELRGDDHVRTTDPYTALDCAAAIREQAEREELTRSRNGWTDDAHRLAKDSAYWRGRAERAEAERDTWKESFHKQQELHAGDFSRLQAERDAAQAAIAWLMHTHCKDGALMNADHVPAINAALARAGAKE